MKSSATRRSSQVLRLGAVAWIVCLCWSSASASILRWAPGQKTEQNKPIVAYAGKINTWTDQGRRYFHVQDSVWISQGVVNLRFSEGVIRIDESRKKESGYYHLDIYAEGAVFVEEGASNVSSERAHVKLKTKSDVNFKASHKTVQKRNLGHLPLVQRGEKVFASKAALPASPELLAKEDAGKIIQTSAIGESDPKAPVLPAQFLSKKSDIRNLWPGLTERPIPKSVTDASSVPELDNPIQLTGGPPAPPPPPPTEQSPKTEAAPPAGSPTPLFPGLGAGGAGQKHFSIRPRSSFQELKLRNFVLPSGETAVVVSSGVILNVMNADGRGGILDIEADQLVFWTTGNTQQILENMQGSTNNRKRSMEFYLFGNVEIRVQTQTETRVLRAQEVYYDVNRHVAIALQADLEVQDPRLLNPIHLQAAEVLQLNENLFEAFDARINASALPYDPGLSLSVRNATLENKRIIRKSIFGFPIIDRATGQPVTDTQRYVRGEGVVGRLEEFPFFYLPYIQGDAEDPLGPLQNISMGYNRIFGFQLYTTWDIYDLIGTTAIPGTRWRLNADVLTDRGPALGSDFTFQGENLLGYPNRYNGVIRAYGLYDGDEDIIGGGRGQFVRLPGMMGFTPVDHPDFRGRFFSRLNVQDLPFGFSVRSQISALSDMNFLEQYYLPEFYNSVNQETYINVKQQQGNWAWTGLVEPRIRRWITETEWFPKLDGYVLGASVFDIATYNLKASAGYAELETTDERPFAFLATDKDTNTGRFDLWQEISVPIPAGPFKVVPFGIVDLTYYSETLSGDDRGRFYGAGGLSASLPMSRLYRETYSELFNVNGIFHKIDFQGKYYVAYSDTAFDALPQLDRLNDDVSDQALRFLFLEQKFINPSNAAALTMSPLFNPQVMALRRLVLNRIDTRDDIEVIQLAVNQRWQTKRGFPGRQHVIDWMQLNLSASLFPRADRDNFGETAAFLEYDWVWNIGDRTSLVSNGWIDPIDNGPRLLNVGANLNRPNNTSLYLGYRQIDPLQSKSIIAAVTYDFSRKYSLTTSAAYDFGIENQATSFVLTRRGKDLRVSLGISYNSIVNSFGLVFEIVPNILPSSIRSPGIASPYTTGLAQ